jgi:hypothetical protein
MKLWASRFSFRIAAIIAQGNNARFGGDYHLSRQIDLIIDG